ncbi:large ribosomal subunit protein mL49 [Phaethornis superciliosus]
MAAMAALRGRLRALGRAVGWRGVQSHPGASSPPSNPPETPPESPPGMVEESTADYVWVERLLPPTRIPDPPQHPSYPTPSGWSPPKGPPPGLPYFVSRSRLHNLPVYPRSGPRRLTELRRVRGDIWALERELREDLGVQEVQVNEVTGTLRLKGDVGGELRRWLLQKGF